MKSKKNVRQIRREVDEFLRSPKPHHATKPKSNAPTGGVLFDIAQLAFPKTVKPGRTKVELAMADEATAIADDDPAYLVGLVSPFEVRQVRARGFEATRIPSGNAYVTKYEFGRASTPRIAIYIPHIDQAVLDVAVDAVLDHKPDHVIREILAEGLGGARSGLRPDAYLAFARQAAQART